MGGGLKCMGGRLANGNAMLLFNKKKWVGGWVLITSNNYIYISRSDRPLLGATPTKGWAQGKNFVGF